MLDENKNFYSIEVDVDTLISQEVFDKLEGEGASLLKVEGLVEGFDAPTNFECSRMFILYLSNPDKLEKIE